MKISTASVSLISIVMLLFSTCAFGQDTLPQKALLDVKAQVESQSQNRQVQKQMDIRQIDSLCVIMMKRRYMHKIWYTRPFITLFERFEPMVVVDIQVHRESPTEVYFTIKLRYKRTHKVDSLDAVIYHDGRCSFDDVFYTTPPNIEYPTVRHWRAVKNYDLLLGMNKQEVKLIWGSPDDIYTTKGRWGVIEQWVYYSKFGGHTRFAYFKNGRLTSIDI